MPDENAGRTEREAEPSPLTYSGQITIRELEDLFRKIESREREPHRCIVHPRGGICLGCGQPWRLVNGRMEPVTWEGSNG